MHSKQPHEVPGQKQKKNLINFKWTKKIYRQSEGEMFTVLEIICIFIYCI